MSKNRIYGEDVIVRLMSNNGIIPYILDFDSIEIQSLTNVKTYKAIGKKVNRHQSINTGYKITLTRAKRDNHLQALINYNDYHIQKGLEPPLFSIDYIVNHNFKVGNINYNEELNIESSEPNNIKKAPRDRSNQKLSGLTDNALYLANNFLRRNQSIAELQNKTKDTIKDAKKIKGAVNYVKNLFNDTSNIRMEDLKLYKEAKEQADSISGEGFKENYHYKNCQIGEFTSSDTIRTNSLETITLYASHKDNLNDDNMYDDYYIESKMKLQYLQYTGEIAEGSKAKVNNTSQPNYQKIITDSLLMSFEEMYGNLL